MPARKATWNDVRRLALALPETDESTAYGLAAWRVGNKLFAWQRPLRPSDLRALGAAAPQGPILGVRVAHLGAKETLLAAEPEVFFTTPHFDGYPAVLVQLDKIKLARLGDLLTEAWLARAPKRLARAFLGRGGAGGPAPDTR